MLSGPPTHLLTLDDAHGGTLVEYVFYPEDELLYLRWHGHLTGAEVIRGVEMSTQWRDQLHYSLILNDKTDSGGDWLDALPWLQYEWLPQAVSAGVRAIAYVFSPDLDNLFASQEFVAAVRPHLAIEMFEDVDAALVWLASHRVGTSPA